MSTPTTIHDLAVQLQLGIKEVPPGQSRTCTIGNPLTMDNLFELSLALAELGTPVEISYEGDQYTFTRPSSAKET